MQGVCVRVCLDLRTPQSLNHLRLKMTETRVAWMLITVKSA